MTTVDPEQLVGTVLAERYRVVRLLGHGANGAVCEVVDQTTQKPAALKLLVAADADLAARLEREGKALSMLAHQHIVELVDSGRLPDNRPYVVTELVRGISLRDEVDARVVEPRRALVIIRQLLEALHHAHAAGLIHRDVKPDNIMLTEGGWEAGEYVKLLDFGVAKVLDPNVLDEAKLTRAGLAVFGTPAYMAPETAIGEPVDVRTDLYSVGIVLFELLTGRLPFDHEDPVTLMRMHVTDAVPLLRDAAPDRSFPAELEQLVAQALDKVPDRRYASAMAMHGAVQTVARSLDSFTDIEGRAFGASSVVPPTAPTPAGRQASWTGAPASLRPPAGNPMLDASSVIVPPPVMPTQRPVLVAPKPAPAPGAKPSVFDKIGDFASATIASARLHPARAAAIVTAAFALVVLLVILVGGGSNDPTTTAETPAKPTKPTPTTPVRKGEPAPVAAQTHRKDADAEFAKKRYGRAVVAYERALAADPALAGDAKVRVAVATIAGRGDPVNAIVALELLASRLDPPDTKTVAELAATSRYQDVRHRAFAIAERDGFVGAVDKYASWSMDLWQGTCPDRKDAIARLVALGDVRAVEQLQKVGKALPCVAKDAAAAVDKLQPPAPAAP